LRPEVSQDRADVRVKRAGLGLGYKCAEVGELRTHLLETALQVHGSYLAGREARRASPSHRFFPEATSQPRDRNCRKVWVICGSGARAASPSLQLSATSAASRAARLACMRCRSVTALTVDAS